VSVQPSWVPSYIQGRWFTPQGEDGQPVRDAATGEHIATLSSAGIDVAATLDYARTVGGPALRELTFHQRAAILKAVALELREHRDELYALSTRTGATRRDSRIDVDGGIGVLLSYASKAKRELPNGTVYVEGAVEPLSKSGRFVAQHIATSRMGAAIQINAFNFPVWGPLEKFAPAFLAGVPSVIKPAGQTGYLTALLVELLVQSELLPPGSVQLISGAARDLLDHVTEQDHISFTGSAATALRLRTHRSVLANGTPFTAETDSLNCSILGLDATAGSAEFTLYVDQLVTEMTVKAGQKCTAIRRALVPCELIDQIEAAVAARLADVMVGNPADRTTTMGPLASLEQREEVRRAVKSLATAGRMSVGDGGFDQVNRGEFDQRRGAFVSPVLIRVEDADRAEPHEVEAFGPVSCLLPYRTSEQAVALAARGAGSLVGSVVTGDPAFARDIVVGIAPWHGRILVLDSDNAADSTGHGSPLPVLIHGGPGRAGGGEELGGVRGVLAYMQRSAVQASPRVLAAVTSRWVEGSPRSEGVHPFRKSLSELRIGDSVTAGPRRVTQDDIDRFAASTGDTFYAHTDPIAAAENPLFGGIVAHGYLVLSLAAGLFVSPEPGPVLANNGLDNLRFLTPVHPGDELSVTLTAKQITPRPDADYGEVRWDAVVTKQDGSVAARYDVLTMVAKENHDGG